MGHLDGRVAIITGAGRGIGRAIALLYAREGARVVVNDLGCALDGTGASHEPADSVVDEIRANGGSACPSYDSVATPLGAEHITEAALLEYGAAHVLVNCAGITQDQTLIEMDPTAWDGVLNVNLRGAFLCLRAAARVMQKEGTGSIVNTTSITAMQGSLAQANVSAAAAGVVALTRTAAIELQRSGIRVNAVAPLASTRMTEGLPAVEQAQNLTPLHVAPAYLFLASDLSAGVTGQVLAVAGGRLATLRTVEGPGHFKEGETGIWSPEEVAENWRSVCRV